VFFMCSGKHTRNIRKPESVDCRWGEALTQNETQVINSALELTAKTAKTAYTPLDKVFMIPSDAIMDSDLCMMILKMGHSRVPVHSPGDRTQILGILLVKELLMVQVYPVSAFVVFCICTR
jgi:metal transporter CNNM